MSMRSFINALSNPIHVPGIESASLAQIVKRQFPVDTILSCLHEISHHWCFQSPVGIAHALTYTDGLIHMFESVTVDPDYSRIARESFIRFSMADALLDPLYDGIALFAEQNLSSLHSETASNPIVKIGMHYGVEMGQNFFKDVSTLLVRARRTISNIRRKKIILSYPGDPASSPYLTGYNTVMNCFHKSCFKVERLRDPDLFIVYFR
jgi:hypothetical protein